MNKAFIFDMDGVLIDSETVWDKQDTGFFGGKINAEIKDKILGSTVAVIYQLARDQGLYMLKDEFYRRYNEVAKKVYSEAKLTDGVEKLVSVLCQLGYKIGLVTSSPRLWVDWVLPRIPNSDQIDYVLSIGDNPELASKPAPDGYLRAIKELGSTPKQTIVLEDSNNGIASAKASGSFVIGMSQHTPDDYQQKGADVYVQDLVELENYLKGLPT